MFAAAVHGEQECVRAPGGLARRVPAPCLRRPLQSAGLLGPASSSRARRQEWGPVFLKPSHGKHGGALGRSCPIDILDGCALVTAKECEHGVLGNREDELPASGCCSGETGEPSRRIRIKLQLHLDASLSKRLVGHDGAACVPGQAVETENDCLGLRRSSRTLFPTALSQVAERIPRSLSDRTVSTLNSQAPLPERRFPPLQAPTNARAERAALTLGVRLLGRRRPSLIGPLGLQHLPPTPSC